jgi:anthranilate phosphoribosyltransferase
VTTPHESFSLLDALACLVERRPLSPDQMRSIMAEMITGSANEAEVSAVLTAMRMKGETSAELAAAAAVLREHMVRLETGRHDLLDTCGTGGDELGTFNISTATALVAAGAGVGVVKHGNRAVSSRSGSADVLAALGVVVEGDAAAAQRCLAEAGLAFCFAPHFHPALRHVAPLRRRLRLRTIFNCLGPLANPAGTAYQLLGVGRPEWLDPIAGALALLGTRHALLVCGRDGLDEVSLAGPTQVREIQNHSVASWEWHPADFGLAPCTLAELVVEGPAQSAAVIHGILEGQEGPATRVVLANAAAALLAAERVATLREGVRCAAEVLASGRAREVLRRLVDCSQQQDRVPKTEDRGQRAVPQGEVRVPISSGDR